MTCGEHRVANAPTDTLGSAWEEAAVWPRGGSEMAARIAAFDWATTPLGPIARWPQSLKNAVDLMIGSPQFTTLAWGPALTLLYNDACANLLGTRHPAALGRTYTEIWRVQGRGDVIGETLSGLSTHFADQFFETRSRVGRPFGWFTGSRTPLRDERGAIVGFYVTGFETTERVLAERAQREREAQQAFLLKLSDTLRSLADPCEIRREACRLLGEHLGTEHAFYMECDEQAGLPVAERADVRTDLHSPSGTSTPSGADWALPIHRQGRTVAVPDVARSEAVPDDIRLAMEARGLVAWIGVPLFKHGRLAGALNVTSGTARPWGDAEIALVREAGERIRAAIGRARAERSAREADARLRTMADAAPVLIWDLDANGTVFVNDHYLAFVGLPLDSSVGRSWTRLLHPEDAEAHNTAFEAAFRNRHPFTHEFRARRADGQYRWLSSSGRPLGEDRFVGVTIDITERRQAEERLKRNNAVLRAINLVFSQTLGAASEEELARISLEVAEDLTGSAIGFLGEIDAATGRLDGFYFSDRSRAAYASAAEGADELPHGRSALGLAIHGIYGQVLREGQGLIVNDPAAHPAGVGTPDGHLPLTAFLGVPLKQGACVRGMIGLGNREGGYRSEDLEAAEALAPAIWHALRSKRSELRLRDTEERFRQFAEASSDVLWIRNADTLEVEFVSPALQAVYGISADDLGRDIRSWIGHMLPEDRENAFRKLTRVRTGESVVNEFRIQRPGDGAFRWIRSTLFPLRDEQGRVRRIGGLSADTTEAKLQAEHQAVLLAELQHRVRNIMAVIRSIVVRTGDRAKTVPEYAALLEGRVLTLARVQALLTRAAGAGVPVAAIVHDEVSAQALRGEQYALSGPEVELSPKAAEILTLAVHELATNAVKYGALAGPEGCVRVRWTTFAERGETWLGFEWTEEGAPAAGHAPADPTLTGRRGFGRELIEGRLPYELSGRARLEIGPGGAHCRLEFPLRAGPSILDTDAPQRAKVSGGSLDMMGKEELSGHRVLVVEDDYYLATDTARALQGAGARVVGPCPTEEAARAALEQEEPTAALIDINLGAGPSFILARLLRQQNVPFVFVTGYDEGVIPTEFSDVERLQKPVELRRVVRFLAETLRAS